jgi:hypothetical protein
MKQSLDIQAAPRMLNGGNGDALCRKVRANQNVTRQTSTMKLFDNDFKQKYERVCSV